jgi:aminoglycoside phosphotransferase (APT) family kinase protein
MLTPDEVGRLLAYLRALYPDRHDLALDHQFRIHGGASRETYSLDLSFLTRGERTPWSLILRRDPAASLIETERAVEFAAYRAAFGTVPVPEAVALVNDTAVLGAPFFVMSRIDGGAAASPFQQGAYADHAADIGRQFFTHLGAIARIDPLASDLPGLVGVPEPEACWRKELDHWAKVIAEDALEPQPTLQAAIRRLRAHPPPPPQCICLVHGDYRSGNFLHDGAGRILAILDWEMAHIGDPFEDLGWALDPLWSNLRPDLAAGMLPQAEAIALWEQASGLRFDAAAFRWWSLFAAVKGMAIWLSASRAFADGKNTDPVQAFSGWYCSRRHEEIVAERLAHAPRGALP